MNMVHIFPFISTFNYEFLHSSFQPCYYDLYGHQMELWSISFIPSSLILFLAPCSCIYYFCSPLSLNILLAEYILFQVSQSQIDHSISNLKIYSIQLQISWYSEVLDVMYTTVYLVVCDMHKSNQIEMQHVLWLVYVYVYISS